MWKSPVLWVYALSTLVRLLTAYKAPSLGMLPSFSIFIIELSVLSFLSSSLIGESFKRLLAGFWRKFLEVRLNTWTGLDLSTSKLVI